MSYGYPPQDPYGQQNSFGPREYGHPEGYGPYGGYGPPPPQPSNASAIAALVCNILLVFCCVPLSITGVVLSALALGRISHDPNSARKLTVWAWICFGVGITIGIAVLAVLFANGYNRDSDTGSYQRA